MRLDVTLRNGDAKRWEAMSKEVAERRDGVEPDRAELARLMMDQFDPESVG